MSSAPREEGSAAWPPRPQRLAAAAGWVAGALGALGLLAFLVLRWWLETGVPPGAFLALITLELLGLFLPGPLALAGTLLAATQPASGRAWTPRLARAGLAALAGVACSGILWLITRKGPGDAYI